VLYLEQPFHDDDVKEKQFCYTPWRHMGGEEI
jgi:hypothetical protein